MWVAKQRILCTLNQGLKDVLNYGLFQPASNGRDGKFLDEERLLREYPQPTGPGVPSLEVPAAGKVVEGGSLTRLLVCLGLGITPQNKNISLRSRGYTLFCCSLCPAV